MSTAVKRASSRTPGAAGHRRLRRAPLLILGAVAVALLAACGTGGGSGGASAPSHQQHNSDPLALQGKLSAMMDDECYTGDPRKVYPSCNKFFTELVGTSNAVDDALPGKPPPVHKAAAELKRGMKQYNANQCGPPDQRIQPAKTGKCAQALRTTRTGMREVYQGLYPHGS